MKRGVFIFWSIFISFAVFRLFTSFNIRAPDIGACIKHTVSGTGAVAVEPERKESGQVFVVHAEKLFVGQDLCGADILVRLKTKLYPRFKYGDRILFIGNLSKPFNFKSDNGRSFDYKGYLAKDDVYYEIKSVEVILQTRKQVESSAGTDFLYSIPEKISSALFFLKRGFVTNLNRELGEPHSALAAGLVVGEKSALGAGLLDDFRIVGLIHIVVLSGFNITIVADALRRMLSFLPRVWGITVGGVGIGLFGILVGGGATVVRSCFMAGVALSADLIRRDYNVTRALIFAGLIMLIQNPMILLHDPSFQLSFLATLGLILLASPIENKLGFIPEKFGIRGIVASTIATQIFVSPYILYMMGQISIIGMVMNILVLPLIPATMLFVFLTGALGFFSTFLAHIVGWITHLLLSYELFMVEHFARIPFASATVPVFSFWWVVAFYVAFAGLFWWVRRRKVKETGFTNLGAVFKEFQKIPKGVLIDKPSELIITDFIIATPVLQLLEMSVLKVFFTRRTLKHIAEKNMISDDFLLSIRKSITTPSMFCASSNSGRFLFARSISEDKVQRFHIVVTELSEKKYFVVVTSFIAKQKYLKNFKILWRTAIPSE